MALIDMVRKSGHSPRREAGQSCAGSGAAAHHYSTNTPSPTAARLVSFVPVMQESLVFAPSLESLDS